MSGKYPRRLCLRHSSQLDTASYHFLMNGEAIGSASVGLEAEAMALLCGMLYWTVLSYAFLW